ncbi:ATP-binding protein [Amorphus orientalis]|uniref:AAA+ superfamily ATPase n=1 Tax=Amorphus orientalis TaxID=649198 RepID=A0AAE3VM58_9HYPH|nr:ATP-binding protein [Amorphus orientalis]MDQ0314603.1 putative AAA+ superfamily ATPase [Amorphus orientalis]
MIPRLLTAKIRSALEKRPAVALLGPRQVGKTTLAREIADDRPSVYLDLERPADLARLDDPDLYFSENADKLIVLDEVQRMPGLFQTLRSRIDLNRREGRRTGQFLLLGSASNELLNQSAESLAGRISYLELPPLNLLEVGPDHLNQLWVGGGFPDAYLDEADSFEWRMDFIRTYLERDIPALGSRIPAETLRRFWTMLAHNQSQLFNASQIGGALEVKGQTASRYLDLLVDLLLVRRLQPWASNVGKRLVKSPKTYIRDSGLTHALLGLHDLDDILGHPVVGGSWEGFVIENLIAAAPAGAEAFFYRTSAGAEIDLLLKFDKELWAIEVKRTTAPTLKKGFHVACEDVNPTAKWLVYAGEETYPVRNDVTVIPLAELMNRLSDS